MLKGPQGKTVLYGGLIILAVAALSWLLLISPRNGQIETLQMDTDNMQSQNLNAEKDLKELEQLAMDAPAAAKRAQALFVRMPGEAAFDEVLTQFENAALDAGIAPENISSISAGIPTPIKAGRSGGAQTAAGTGLSGMTAGGASLADIPITIALKGTPDQVYQFIDNIQNFERIFIIDGLAVANRAVSEGIAPEQTLSVKGKMFLLQSALPDLVKQVDDLLAAADFVAPPGGGGETTSPDGTTVTPDPAASGAATPAPSGSAAATPAAPTSGSSAAPSGGTGLSTDTAASPAATPAPSAAP